MGEKLNKHAVSVPCMLHTSKRKRIKNLHCILLFFFLSLFEEFTAFYSMEILLFSVAVNKSRKADMQAT